MSRARPGSAIYPPDTGVRQAGPERSLLSLPANSTLIVLWRSAAPIRSIIRRSGTPVSLRTDRRVPSADGRTGRRPSPHEQARGRDEPLPAPARAQPRRLVCRGDRDALARATAARPADLPVDRVRRLSLVPRDGARVVRGRGDGGRAERWIRRDQGGSRGAPRPRPAVHGGRPDDDRGRRLADERVPHARRAAVLRRHLLPRHARATGCRRSARCSRACGPRGRRSGRRWSRRACGSSTRWSSRRRSGPAGGPSVCRRARRSTLPPPRSRPRSTRSTAAGDARRSSRSR